MCTLQSHIFPRGMLSICENSFHEITIHKIILSINLVPFELLVVYHLSFSIGVFALPGDPYSSDKIAAAIACQQLVAFNSRNRTLFVKTALERQHKLVSLPIYSTLSEYKLFLFLCCVTYSL